jgi:hypothetical protein
MNAPDSPELMVLREIRDELRALPAAFAAAIKLEHRAPRRLSSADETMLRPLLTAIIDTIGTRDFYVRDLINHAKLDIASAIALQKALASIGGALKIGRLLRRGVNADTGIYRVIAIGPTRDGVLWKIECDESITAKSRKTRTPADGKS